MAADKYSCRSSRAFHTYISPKVCARQYSHAQIALHFPNNLESVVDI
jgi:hypothetical protein